MGKNLSNLRLGDTEAVALTRFSSSSYTNEMPLSLYVIQDIFSDFREICPKQALGLGLGLGLGKGLVSERVYHLGWRFGLNSKPQRLPNVKDP